MKDLFSPKEYFTFKKMRLKLLYIFLFSVWVFFNNINYVSASYHFDQYNNRYDVKVNADGSKFIKGIDGNSRDFEIHVDPRGNMTGINAKGEHWTFRIRDQIYYNLTTGATKIGRPKLVRYEF